MKHWYGKKSSLFISAARRCVGGVTAGIYPDVRHFLRSHGLKYVAIHQRADALTLVGGMNGIDANGARLLRALNFVMDKTYRDSVLLSHKEAIPCA
jgi:hypothetical protein